MDAVGAVRAVVNGLAVDPHRIHGVGGPVLDGAVRHPEQQRGLAALGPWIVRHRIAGGSESVGGSRQVLQLKLAVGGGERVSLQGLRVRVAHDHLREGVPFKLRHQVHPGCARQVVQPVTVLQIRHLAFEDVVEGAAQQAPEQIGTFGQAAHPEVDVVQAAGGGGAVVGPCIGAVHERHGVIRGNLTGQGVRADNQPCCFPLRLQCGGGNDGGVGAVGSDEVDQRSGVLDVLAEIDPVGVGLELAVVGGAVEVPAEDVQGRDPLGPAAGQVDGSEVHRQAQELAAQGVRDELIKFRAHLVRHAHDDAAGGFLGGQRTCWPAVGVGRRVQESTQERQVVLRTRHVVLVAPDAVGSWAVLVAPRDGFGEHRMPKTVDRVGKLRVDGRIDVGLGEREGFEDVQRRLDLAGKLLEDKVLVLHFRHEARCLEEALAVPAVSAGGRLPFGEGSSTAGGLVRAEDVLDVPHQAVVLGVEDLMDCRQTDVLVDPSVAGDEVRIQHLVVVRPGSLGRKVCGRRLVRVGCRCRRRRCRVVVGVLGRRIGVVGDVCQERCVEVQRILRYQRSVAAVRGPVRLHQPGPGDELRKPVFGARDELAVGVGRQQRNVEDVLVQELDAEHFPGLLLGVGPSGHAAGRRRTRRAAQQAAGGDRPALGVVGVFAQEDLVRGVGRVGLALVHPRRVGVQRVLEIVGGAQDAVRAGLVLRPGEDHEAHMGIEVVGGAEDVVRPCNERIVGLERHVDRPAALDGLVDAVVEELAEQGKERIIGR